MPITVHGLGLKAGHVLLRLTSRTRKLCDGMCRVCTLCDGTCWSIGIAAKHAKCVSTCMGTLPCVQERALLWASDRSVHTISVSPTRTWMVACDGGLRQWRWRGPVLLTSWLLLQPFEAAMG